ncbi:hypothetical protein ACFQNE_01990 [Gordonia phosphorivorans]|uniref:Uncharacterized protein n=1 Tax=Gordonia phosphorivorans TaxID=1056982 RepID=A0ABV6H6K0_9ACTN
MTGPKLHHLLLDLAEDWKVLRGTLPQPLSSNAGRRAGGRREFGHPAEWASDHAAQIVDCVLALHDMVAEYRGETAPAPMILDGRRQRQESAVLRESLTYLVPRTDWLCTQGRWVPLDEVPPPWAVLWQWRVDDEALDELRSLHHRIRLGLGHGRRRTVLPMPCPAPDCGLLTLERVPGMYGAGDFIVCGACDYRTSEAEYGFLARVLADIVTDEQMEAATGAAGDTRKTKQQPARRGFR